MTTSAFQKKHPKPWRFVIGQTGFALRDANDQTIATLSLGAHHSGIPQNQWNALMADAMREHLPVEEGDPRKYGSRHAWGSYSK